METSNYQSPQVEVLTVCVEQGFAASFEGILDEWDTQEDVEIVL